MKKLRNGPALRPFVTSSFEPRTSVLSTAHDACPPFDSLPLSLLSPSASGSTAPRANRSGRQTRTTRRGSRDLLEDTRSARRNTGRLALVATSDLMIDRSFRPGDYLGNSSKRALRTGAKSL